MGFITCVICHVKSIDKLSIYQRIEFIKSGHAIRVIIPHVYLPVDIFVLHIEMNLSFHLQPLQRPSVLPFKWLSKPHVRTIHLICVIFELETLHFPFTIIATYYCFLSRSLSPLRYLSTPQSSATFSNLFVFSRGWTWSVSE